jgi:hypothetical protein
MTMEDKVNDPGPDTAAHQLGETDLVSGRLAAIRGVLSEFDWDSGDRQAALERIEQIAAASRTASGTEPGGSATITQADLRTMLDALEVAADYKRDRAASCPDCDASPEDLCGTCESRLARAGEYDALAARIGRAR